MTRVIVILRHFSCSIKFLPLTKGTLLDTEPPATEPCPQPVIYSTYPHNFLVFLSTYTTNIVCIPQYKFNVRATCVYHVTWSSDTYTNIHNATLRFAILTRYSFSILINMSILKQGFHEVKIECFFLCFLSLLLLTMNVHEQYQLCCVLLVLSYLSVTICLWMILVMEFQFYQLPFCQCVV